MYHKRKGDPDKSFFAALGPRLEPIVGTKIAEDILPIGSRAGAVTPEMAEQTGLACEMCIRDRQGDGGFYVTSGF